MSFQSPISIADAIEKIRQRRLLLPAIQREFVWGHKKIEWLFDSLLQRYPFGSFLFWEVRDAQMKGDYRYYECLREYRERYRTHNPEFNTQGHTDFEAVLDGQQRLTSLYIGLTGTFAYKLPRVRWQDAEHAVPTRTLYLNVGSPPPEDDEEETGRLYEFRFLTETEQAEEPAKWFKAGDILTLSEVYPFQKMLKERRYEDNEFAVTALSTLHSVIHIQKLINYYLIQRSDMERALNVFVRVNSGGESLSLSDMLMSTAIAHWTKKDARKEMLGLVDYIRAQGFFISKDLVLKACLYLYSSDIRYKVSNFSAAQVRPFEDNWDEIQLSIRAVFALVRDFGFDDSSLTSKNALLPIIYWVHHKALGKGLTSCVDLHEERETIRHWLHAMLLKGIVGTSADTVLASIRRVFFSGDFGAEFLQAGIPQFPARAIGGILEKQGKDPRITDEFIDSLLFTQYEDKHAFSILALLSPNLDYKNGDFHKDHLHPASAFKKRALQDAGVPESDREFYLDPRHWNSILNLRHLDANENMSKQDGALAAWIASEAARQRTTAEKFCVDRDLPTDAASLGITGFRKFIETRRALLRDRLKQALQ